jgi:Cd2+/Zn2+-exporting ATPase
MNDRQKYVVGGVCCSTEEGVLRRSLDGGLGPRAYDFSLLTGELTVDALVEEATVLRLVRRAGFQARTRRALPPQRTFLQRHEAGLSAGLALLLTIAGALMEFSGAPDLPVRGTLLAAIILGGWRVALKAVKALRFGTLDMNVLMVAAVIGAITLGEWTEAALVIVLFAVSLMLETYSTARARRAVEELIDLSPQQARVLRNGTEVSVAAGEVRPGETILVHPGERIPLDGVIREGTGTVNQASITGEAVDVTRGPGETVFSGSVNGRTVLRVDVTREYDDSTLARMIHLIEDAHQKRASAQRFVDRFAAVYTPTVFAGALLVAAVPPMLFGAPFAEWFYRALVLLVIACPCALVISLPVTVVSALAAAARRGILIKGGTHLEALSVTRAVAFDKTGTLTRGEPQITSVTPVGGMRRDDVLPLLAAIEHRSEHHLGQAVLAEAARAGIEYGHLVAESFEVLPGTGVRAEINGTAYVLGNRDLMMSVGAWTPDVEAIADSVRADGSTVMGLAADGRPLCVVGARDTARLHARHAIEGLRREGIAHIVLLSGDDGSTTRRLAEDLKMDDCQGGLLPEQKVAAVEALKRAHGTVAMVGDGLNDAPALSAASVGIAMGVAGSDAALETADVVLMSDDIARLPSLVSLSRRAMRVVRQNIAIALGLKAVFLVLALTGHATLWMAVLADDGAALAVILNGLRLLGPFRLEAPPTH